jgi:hypothetical protein
MRHIEITSGNDYTGTRAISATGDGWGDDVTAARLIITDRCSNSALPVVDVIGTYTVPTINNRAVAFFDLVRAETLKLRAAIRGYDYEIKGLTAANGLITLERGVLSCLKGGL